VKPHAIFGALAITAALVSVAVQAQTPHNGVDRHHGDSQFPIEVLSSRPDAISGGDALVRVTVKKNVPASAVRIKLNGADITSSFVVSANMLTGLVGGMRVGENLLEVIDPRGNVRGNGRADADIVLRNYPIEGPMLSGPHEQPYACATQQFNLPGGAGNLGAPLDANCSINRRVDYFYKSTANTGNNLTQWPAGATEYPANMVRTNTTTAMNVPYIVRIETGTINRAIYQTTVLHDPLTESAPRWNNQPAHWNKRLVYTFGGGCIGGWYRQGASTGGVVDNFMLSSGYALASSSLNVFGNNCNDLTASETMAMVKERFIEAYGPPAHTQGWGCSGGSYAQHQIGDNFPGLLEGIIPGCSFPEVGFATINFITDAWLLDDYFTARQAAMGWSDEQKRRVTGFHVYATAPNVEVGAHRIDPRPGTTSCTAVPVEQRYNPATNPTGVRCTVHDHTVNVYGRDPANGFARRPLDNTGIQYGLKVLNDTGTNGISVDQFLDLKDRRLRRRRQPGVAAHRRGPDRGARRLPDRAPDQRRRRARVDSDHRLPRLQRRRSAGRHPCSIPLLLHAEAPGQGQRAPREPRDGGERQPLRPLQQQQPAAARDDPQDGPLGHRDQGRRARHSADREDRAEQARRRGGGLLYEGCGAGVHRRDADARAGGRDGVQHALSDQLVPARGRRRRHRGRHHQVPAQAARRRRLREALQRGTVGAAAGDLPVRRVRLVQARARAAGSARHVGVL
jgi:hypothetical protein